MKLPLLRYGNPLLRSRAEKVVAITDEVRAFIEELEETMHSFQGLGIAATQVGKMWAIFLIAPPLGKKEGKMVYAATRVFINPKLSNPSKESWSHVEANPVLPGISCEVIRPRSITCTAQDINGHEFTETFYDWPARIIMHENDHLNGVLFIDRLSKELRKNLEPKLILISSQPRL